MEIANLPEFKPKDRGGWYYKRDLYLGNKDVSSIIWPDNLTVIGGLYLNGSNIKKLPDNLTINGGLYLNRCEEITSLPKNLKCNVLDIIDTNIKEIKKDVEIESVLYITSISDIELEEGFWCEGILQDLSNQDVVLNTLNLKISQKIYNSLPKSLTRNLSHYYPKTNSFSFRYRHVNEKRKKIRRNLNRTINFDYYYRFFEVGNKELLIKELYEKSNPT